MSEKEQTQKPKLPEGTTLDDYIKAREATSDLAKVHTLFRAAKGRAFGELTGIDQVYSHTTDEDLYFSIGFYDNSTKPHEGAGLNISVGKEDTELKIRTAYSTPTTPPRIVGVQSTAGCKSYDWCEHETIRTSAESMPEEMAKLLGSRAISILWHSISHVAEQDMSKREEDIGRIAGMLKCSIRQDSEGGKYSIIVTGRS